MDEVKKLAPAIQHAITTARAMASVADVIGQLVENALDADATVVEVRLLDHGAADVEVIDDGRGVQTADFDRICSAHSTSKEENTRSFGFRGVALNALCALAKVTIVTRSENDKNGATKLVFDGNGRCLERTPTTRTRGTTVHAIELFHALPVRRAEILRNAKHDLPKTLHLLHSYALMKPNVKFRCILTSTKGAFPSTVLSTPGGSKCSVQDVCHTLWETKGRLTMLPLRVSDELPSEAHQLRFGIDGESEFNGIRISGWIGSPDQSAGGIRAAADRQHCFVNHRPVAFPELWRAVNDVFRHYTGGKRTYCTAVIFVEVPNDELDVNLTADKRIFLMKRQKPILAMVCAALDATWQNAPVDVTQHAPSSIPASKKMRQTEIEEMFSVTPPPSQDRVMIERRDTHQETLAKTPAETPAKIPAKTPAETNNAEATDNENVEQQYASGLCVQMHDSTVVAARRNDDQQDRRGLDRPPATVLRVERHVKRVGSSPSLDNADLVQPHKRQPPPTGLITATQLLLDPFCEKILVGKSAGHSATEIAQPEQRVTRESEGRTEEEDKENVANDQDGGDCVAVPSQAHHESVPTTSNAGDNSNDLQTVQTIDWTMEKLRLMRAKRALTSLSQQSCGSRSSTGKASVFKPNPNEEGQGDGEDPADSSLTEEAIVEETEDNEVVTSKKQLYLSKNELGQLRAVGQFNAGFIVAQRGSHLFLVDQHAADEKANFERLQRTTTVQSQPLVCPHRISLGTLERAVLLDNLELLKRSGYDFKIGGMDSDEVSLAALPSVLGCLFDVNDLQEVLAALLRHEGMDPRALGAVARPSRWRRILASRACRHSVMVGKVLAAEEQRQILTRLATLAHPWSCPHGRPTIRHLCSLGGDDDDERIAEE